MSWLRRTTADKVGSGTSSGSFPVAQTPIAGNTLFIIIESVAAPGSNTATGFQVLKDVGFGNAANTGNSLSLLAKTAVGNETTFAINTVAGAFQFIALEYSGGNNIPAVETSNSTASGTGTAITAGTGSISTAYANDLILVSSAQSASNGNGTGWATATNIQPNNETRLIVGQYIPGTSLTGFSDTASWTTALKNAAFIVALRAATNSDFLQFM